jgi:hypothetical protein
LSIIGLILRFLYRLRRHFLLGWSLARWLGVLLAVAIMATLFPPSAINWRSIPVGGLFLAYVGALFWADRRGFVHFRAAVHARRLILKAPVTAPLRSEERISVQASGWFTVEGKDQYCVCLHAEFESVSSREHIVLARVQPSRHLLLGTWPEHELGWWYIFFQPAMIRQIRAGYLYFGPRPRLALRIVYTPGPDARETIHLASGAATLRRIWVDLNRDAPPGAGSLATGNGV